MDQQIADRSVGAVEGVAPPRLYHLCATPAEAQAIERARALGFTHVIAAPGSGFDATAFAALCLGEGLVPLLDLDPIRLEIGLPGTGPLYDANEAADLLDPRALAPDAQAAFLRAEADPAALGAFWAERAAVWRAAGIAGFRILLKGLSTAQARALLAALRRDEGAVLLGWTPGLSREERLALIGSGLDYVFASLPWWDFSADWIWTEAEELRRIAPVIAPVEAPFGSRFAAGVSDLGLLPWAQRRILRVAAAIGDGWLMAVGFEWGETRQRKARDVIASDTLPPADPGLAEEIATANRAAAFGVPCLLTGPGAVPLALLRVEVDLRYAQRAELTLVNTALDRPNAVPVARLRAALGGRFALPGLEEASSLQPGEVRRLSLSAWAPPPATHGPLAASAILGAARGRVGIERIAPAVDDGRFAAKRIAGETVTVGADLIVDGHDQLAAVLLWRPEREEAWRETRMHLVINDRWEAGFPLDHVGRYVFAIESWRDAFATFRDELFKKHNAGIDVRVELMEGAALVRQAGAPLAATVARLEAAEQPEKIRILLSDEVALLMLAADTRPRATRSADYVVDADRIEAGFASWYEIFPRSMSDDESRHGTFDDVIRHLPRIRDMGFDVLYFPPVHPIGRANRKGRNNTLTPSETDPGSPYAIGSAEGGHDALHPELGTLDDFRRMREAAEAHGLEIALDFAIQCSPDHPWLKAHKGWFDWRPDGSIKYAENPPKKYQDIVNVDFYTEEAIPGLWVALCEVVLFWCEQGVRIFRVDNPHTKSFAFWEWMIAEVRARFPGTQFLAEAFTRPKIMNRLGKIGFTQSYTYFTWRNGKAEIEDYLTALSTPPISDFYRPNFFVNTPDINPVFLQTHGRAGHLTRAALAATLSGLWGVYSGFELCDAAPLPGREEYIDSEKYQLRAWDWQKPGNIVAEITQLNRIRKQNPALQSVTGLSFLPARNDRVIFYEKATADRDNVLLVVVNLDPRDGDWITVDLELPLWKWGLPDSGRLAATDLMRGERFVWQGKWQSVTLDPAMPFTVWRVQPESI